MGKRELLAALTALVLGVDLVPAQGPVYRERWGYLHLERLRDRVYAELAGRDDATRHEAGRLLAATDPASPFAPVARALAQLRGVEADPAFLLRASLGAFVLPEVIDPEGRTEVCRDLNVTLFLAFGTPDPGPLAHDVTVHDAAGKLVFEGQITRDAAVSDLRRARAEIEVPGSELADGSYRLEVATRIGGAPPRPADPRLQVTFHVLRGYQARSEAAMTRTRDVHEDLEPVSRALLLGLGAEVSRAYSGEAFDGESMAVTDLERLEAALTNLAEQRPVLHGLYGDIATAVPAGVDELSCVLRLGESHHPEVAGPARPLLIIADGAPAYGPAAYRPTSPGVRGPRWLARAMPELGKVAGDDFDVAFLASPGNGRDYAAALPAAVASLRSLLGTGERPVVLVCEREAAAVTGFALGRLLPQLHGCVLIGAGAIPKRTLDGLGDCIVRLAPLQDYPSSQALRRVLDYVDAQRQAGTATADVARLAATEPAWPFGTRALVEPIRAFMRRIVDG